MARMSVSFFPPSLFRTAELELFHPGDTPPMFRQNNPCYERPAKTLILLHGYSGGKTDWMLNSPIQDLAARYNLAVACPAGENSFYLNQKGTGRAFGDYIGRDLPQFLRDTFGLAKNSEDTLIGGYSMGGFGALHAGLSHPETFGHIIALSSALMVHEVAQMTPRTGNHLADYDYNGSCWQAKTTPRPWFGNERKRARPSPVSLWPAAVRISSLSPTGPSINS